MIARAVARLRRRGGALLALAALNLAFALLATTPLSAPLGRALDLRPAAAQVADSADDAPRVELLQDHPELVPSALSAALLALIIWSVLSTVACGGLLAPVEEPFVAACAIHARRMLSVGAVGLPLRLVSLLGPMAAWLILGDAHSFGGIATGVAVGALIGGALWSLTTVTLDRARGFAVAEPSLSAWRAVRAGVAASFRRGGATLALAAFSGLGFVSTSLIQAAVTHALPATTWATVVALGATVVGAIGRAAFTATTLIAAQL